MGEQSKHSARVTALFKASILVAEQREHQDLLEVESMQHYSSEESSNSTLLLEKISVDAATSVVDPPNAHSRSYQRKKLINEESSSTDFQLQAPAQAGGDQGLRMRFVIYNTLAVVTTLFQQFWYEDTPAVGAVAQYLLYCSTSSISRFFVSCFGRRLFFAILFAGPGLWLGKFAGETALETSVKVGCSLPIFATLLPVICVTCSSKSTYVSKQRDLLAELITSQEAFEQAVKLNADLLPMTTDLILGEVWIREAAVRIEASDLSMRTEFAEAHRNFAKNLWEASLMLANFVNSGERALDLIVYSLESTKKDVVKVHDRWLPQRWWFPDNGAVLQQYIKYIEYLEREISLVIDDGNQCIQTLLRLHRVDLGKVRTMKFRSENDIANELDRFYHIIPWLPATARLHRQQELLEVLDQLHERPRARLVEFVAQLVPVQLQLKDLKDALYRERFSSELFDFDQHYRHLGHIIQRVYNSSEHIRIERKREDKRRADGLVKVR